MLDIFKDLQEFNRRIKESAKLWQLADKKKVLTELVQEQQVPNFWQQREHAKSVNQQIARLQEDINSFEDLITKTNDLLEFASALNENDEQLIVEVKKKFKEIADHYQIFELKILLAQKYDQNNAIVAIHAGTGGTDAQDWTEMLERMYLRYCERRKFSVKIIDRQIGQEAGLKSVTFEVNGHYAYGYLKAEAGVHRLVRISPFDAEKMRHTSFALVEVLPIIEDDLNIDIKEEDLEIDTYRSSGHGGQSVNTTDSAVRIKHKPTGIVVTCQNERSQFQNKTIAMKILISRIKSYLEAEQEEEKKKIKGEFSEAAWGNQIRSYVLQPYKMVKDHRTEYETQDVEEVLNGKLDKFIEAYLKNLKS